LRHAEQVGRIRLAHAGNSACQFPHAVGAQLEISASSGGIADRIKNIIKPLPLHFFNSASSSRSRFLANSR
jgi:hypothetical protein